MKSKTMKNKMPKHQPKKRVEPGFSGALLIAIVLAVLSASGILVYLKLSYWGKFQESKSVSVVSEKKMKIKDAINEKLPVKKRNMSRPSLEELKGKWFTVFNENAIAEITLGDKVFEIIFTQDAQGRERKYSRGIYYYDPKLGMLSLRPDRRMGEPEEIEGVRYKVLTARPFTFYVLREPGSRDLHFTALEEDVTAKQFHPLFLYADYSGAPVLKFSPTEIK